MLHVFPDALVTTLSQTSMHFHHHNVRLLWGWVNLKLFCFCQDTWRSTTQPCSSLLSLCTSCTPSRGWVLGQAIKYLWSLNHRGGMPTVTSSSLCGKMRWDLLAVHKGILISHLNKIKKHFVFVSLLQNLWGLCWYAENLTLISFRGSGRCGGPGDRSAEILDKEAVWLQRTQTH